MAHRAAASLPLRLMHWINLLCMLVLVGSGLQIFNAHPALYWGAASTFRRIRCSPTDAVRGADGKARGITTHRRCTLRHHRRARRVGARRRHAREARISRVGDDPRFALAGAGPALAFLLRLAVGDQRHLLPAVVAGQPAPVARPGDAAPRLARRSAHRSSTTCASAIRSATRRRATTRCRSWPTSA